MIRQAVGIVIILAGIAIGIYLGLYICLWGGVLTIIDAVGTGAFLTFIWGVLKIMFAGAVGWGSFWICTVIGMVLLEN